MDLVPEHGYLVAQHDDFDRQVLVLAKAEPNQLEDATERWVEEREATAGDASRVEIPLSRSSSTSTDVVFGTYTMGWAILALREKPGNSSQAARTSYGHQQVPHS